jgi:cell wall-associated NlpC family hydrolase
VGVLPRKGDWTADALSKKFIQHVTEPRPGDLVFWVGSSMTRIVHVEIYIGSGLSIGASGGGSRTKTIKDAMKHNAFIKIRPVNSRGGTYIYGNPYAKDI